MYFVRNTRGNHDDDLIKYKCFVYFYFKCDSENMCETFQRETIKFSQIILLMMSFQKWQKHASM